MTESIKMSHAALDETPEKEVILRGRIHPDSLRFLQVADYQREVLPLSTINGLMEAFKTGSVPDIDLGMRGERFLDRGGNFYLKDPVFIIDGLQRVTAANMMLQDGSVPRIGATVHFSTDEEWERNRFKILNADMTKLSSNILLRNMRHEIDAINLLYRLCDDKAFAMYDRINWEQRQKRHELISAVTLLKVAGALHSHIGPGKSSRIKELAPGVDKIVVRIGKNVFRDNMKTFFQTVDQCWGIQRVAYKEGAIYLRSGFLLVLATIFSNHTDFWRENRLFVEAQLIRKIQSFPISDPSVVNLSSATGKARELLYTLLVNHINSGKRTRRLTSRTEVVEIPS